MMQQLALRLESALPHGEIVIDLFAGGGGASLGIEQALGVRPALAINHDPMAIAMHAANHPETVHLREDIYRVVPSAVVAGRKVGLLWASPDCRHFSRAKGAKPVSKKIRSLASVVIRWAKEGKPRVICLENVPEFTTWGPLIGNRPDPARAGNYFQKWLFRLRRAGYTVEWRLLSAADYGAPTTRKRLFLVARNDNEPIRWPAPTHGPGRAHPWRTAEECIDWSLPCPSIFSRQRPHADATCRRIARGLVRYALHAPKPYLIQTGYGEREGQAPRCPNIEAPLGTVVAGGSKHALLIPFLAKHYGGVVGQDVRKPIGTITATDHHSLVLAHLAPAEVAKRGARIASFLLQFHTWAAPGKSLDFQEAALFSQALEGLIRVTVNGEEYVVVDIGMRMLAPHELALAQGFPPSYILTGSQTVQIRRIGNSVCPDVARSLVAANLLPQTVFLRQAA